MVVYAAGSASADIATYDLTTTDLSSTDYTGPFVQVTVDLTSSTQATITFDSLTNGGYTYLMHSQGAAAVNVNGTFSLVTTGTDAPSALNSFSSSGFSTPGPISDGGSGQEDSYGNFNQTLTLFDGFDHSRS